MSETGAPSAQHPSTAQLLQQGLFHHQRGELAPAMENYTQVLRTDPQNADALYYVAVVACQENQFEQGIGLARRALEAGPPQARVHNLLGKALERQGDPLEAVKAFDAAIALDPNLAEAHGNRAAILAAAGLPDEALAGFDRALALDPAAVADWINRGALLQSIERHDEALESYDKALALTPDDPTVLFNRANALSMLTRYAEAEAVYDRVIARNPKFAVAYLQKGLAVKHQGRLQEARTLLTQAHAMDDKNSEITSALSLLMLLMGDWRRAWPLFEARAQLANRSYEPLEAPRWRGEPPGDFRLVLVSEQGLGDRIHFGRYASLLAGRGYDVTLLAPPQLAPLLRGLPRVERVAASLEEIADDKRRMLWFPLMSVMGALHFTPDAIPAQDAYLQAEPARAERWAERLGRKGCKVGIVWQGTSRGSAAPLSALAPLADVAGIRLISLQKEVDADTIAQAPFGGGIETPLDAGDLSAEGVLDTAAVMANLDAVVSIDSMPAHLAGALGKPVLVALPFVPDWRWLTEGADTPWYPTMQLYRQDATRDWTPVFQRIADDLQRRAAAIPSSQK
jgi:tetratricopeptide (TPR) repeat protein